ncbi:MULTISPECIES: copper homeostasis protein CutC [Rhodobacterales]|uniref:copper homeostasis protein CutC n=1 Tax=Rhodobacterales TaxID=204455 RepID=UPI0015F0F8DD|nr:MULTISPECIES: copper homeostasis protein CutC [Rhodobacterales]MDO6591893.1 copper homeostasis protein CutC [Yoonia sp. 1_MG-2023]
MTKGGSAGAKRPVALLEVCVDSLSDAFIAFKSGADRIELCAGLSAGGLTPSYGAVRAAVALGGQVIVLIRPSEGGFIYQFDEIAQMVTDIELARDAGAAGVAIGVLSDDLTLDMPVMKRLCDAAAGMQIVLHRAFDLVPDPFVALNQAIDLGIVRILTSGQKATAYDGRELLARLVTAAKGRIEILPGAGVRPETAVTLMNDTKATQLHSSCRVNRKSDPRLAAFGFAPADEVSTISAARIKEMKNIMESAL